MHTEIRSNRLARVPTTLVALVGALLVAGSALASDPPEPVRQRVTSFGQVGIVAGQAIVLNVVNDGLANPPDPVRPGTQAPPDPVVVAEIVFLAGDGSVFKRTVVTIPPHQSATFTIDSREVLLPGTAGRVGLRARVNFSNPPDPIRGFVRTVSTLEMVDTATGQTSFVLSAPPEPV